MKLSTKQALTAAKSIAARTPRVTNIKISAPSPSNYTPSKFHTSLPVRDIRHMERLSEKAAFDDRIRRLFKTRIRPAKVYLPLRQNPKFRRQY